MGAMHGRTPLVRGPATQPRPDRQPARCVRRLLPRRLDRSVGTVGSEAGALPRSPTSGWQRSPRPRRCTRAPGRSSCAESTATGWCAFGRVVVAGLRRRVRQDPRHLLSDHCVRRHGIRPCDGEHVSSCRGCRFLCYVLDADGESGEVLAQGTGSAPCVPEEADTQAAVAEGTSSCTRVSAGGASQRPIAVPPFRASNERVDNRNGRASPGTGVAGVPTG